MSEKSIVDVDDTHWELLVERSKLPVAVMFYNPSCEHCMAMMPHFEKFAEDMKDKMVFARIDVDRNHYAVERYGVMATPTFKFFCGGRPVQEIVGEVYPPLIRKVAEDSLTHGKECISKSTPIDFNIGYA